MSLRMAFLGLAVAGCVAEGDPPAEPVAATSEALTQAEANAAGRVLAAGVEQTAGRFGPVASGAAAAIADAECLELSGDSSDADGDSIPVDATLSFDCRARRLGTVATLTGTESVTDRQPNAAAWAFTADLDLHASLTGPFGGSIVTDSVGSVLASQESLLGPFRLASTLDVLGVITNTRGVAIEIAEDLDLQVSYTPDVRWAPGEATSTGSLVADGAWGVAVDAKSIEATLATPAPLVLTASCESRVTSGQITATFASGAAQGSITVTWSGCGDSVVTYDPGDESDDGL